MRSVSRPLRHLAAFVMVLFLVPAAPAWAGRLVATGHDADLHCAGGTDATGPQCHYLKVVVSYVRAGAPDPSKPVLVLDNHGLAAVKALDNAFGVGAVPRVVMDPSSPAFAGTPINTASYSALLVASDASCGGCDLNQGGTTSDSAAINARAADIAAFFNAGGGIVALAGAGHGGASGADNTYYQFVPLPLGGAPVSPPFKLTAVGSGLGLLDPVSGSDINCCATHNSFALPPAGSALTVAENDSMGLAETLVAEGAIKGGTIVKPPPPAGGLPPAFGPTGVIDIPSSKRCLSKRHFKIHIRNRRGLTYVQATVFVNKKQVGVIRGRQFSSGVDLRGLPAGTFSVKIIVITTTGQVITGTRTYHTCRKRLPFLGPPRL
jgi:hypothetical protein